MAPTKLNTIDISLGTAKQTLILICLDLRPNRMNPAFTALSA